VSQFATYPSFSEFPYWYQIACFALFGLCIGSFLNVCIYRIPAGRSLLRPGSSCQCGERIKPWDNIPVLSWFLLRGKARCCHAPISKRYPAIEALTAVLFILCWLRLPFPISAAYSAFAACLLAGSVIDLDHTVLPDRFTIGLAVAGLIVSGLIPGIHLVGRPPGGWWTWHAFYLGIVGLAGGTTIIAWLMFLGEMVLGREVMGQGDIKLMGAIGAWTGVSGSIAAIFLGCCAGSLLIAACMALRIRVPKEIPFGPMLATGAVAWVLLPHTFPWFAALASFASA